MWVDKMRSGSFGEIPVSSAIYRFIWLLGLFATFTSIVVLGSQGRLGLSGVFGKLLAVLSVIILALTYFDMEEVERLGNKDHDYPGWVGKWQEVLLRLLIVICLLLSVGELHVFLRLAIYCCDGVLYVIHAVATLLGCSMGSPPPTPVDHPTHLGELTEEVLFIVGSSSAFLLICAWNICAFHYRLEQHQVKWPKVMELGATSRAAYHLVYVRIGFYALIGLISCVYWIFVGCDPGIIATFATTFIILYFFLISAVTLFRVKWTRSIIESRLGKIYSGER